jgi:hypothetical protein
MRNWFQRRLESILDNVIFAGLLAGVLAVWAIIQKLPGPIIAVVFLLAASAILWILGQLRSRTPKPAASTMTSVPGEQKYLPDSYIRGRIINLLDMIPPGATPIISDRTIEDCEIRGPSIIAPLQGVTMNECGFDGDPDSVFIEVPEGRIVGAVGLKDCVFRRCQFKQIGIIGASTVIRKIREGFIPPVPK